MKGKSRYAPNTLICDKKHNSVNTRIQERLGDAQDRLSGTEFGPESKCSKGESRGKNKAAT